MPTADKRIRFPNHEQVRSLFGTNDRHLRRLREQLQIEIVLRGDELRLSGESERVDRGSEVVGKLQSIIQKQGELSESEVDRVLDWQSHRDHEETVARDASIDVFHKSRRVHALGAGQRAYIEAIRHHDLVFATGPAGSGKTYLAVAMAINALRQERVRKIVLTRPAVEAGEKLGFLPGDLFAKVNPYLRPLLDALGDILDYDTVQRYLDKDVIEIVPLAFMRGRTLNQTFIILDEAQNTTTTQMKMFLTRLGQHSKIVVTGDETQSDLPEHTASGLQDAVQRLQRVPGIAVIRLQPSDIVRHPLVRRIVAAYDDEGILQRDAIPPAIATSAPRVVNGEQPTELQPPATMPDVVAPESLPDTSSQDL